MVQLFDVYSIVDNFRGRDGVQLRWICRQRERPVAPGCITKSWLF
jgi:hypothetical protein